MNYISLRKNSWLYFIFFISIILLIGEVLNGRFWMHDLEVYYRTANRMLHQAALYRIKADGHYVYKYAPTAGTYFIPFLLLPFSAAKVIYWFLLTGITAYILQLLYSLTREEPGLEKDSRKNKVLLLAFLVMGAHYHREWHLGQVNLILLLAYVFVTKSLIKDRPLAGGFWLAFSLFLKPFGLIFFPYLLIQQKYKHLLYAFIFLVILGFIPFIFYPSVPAFKQLYLSWFTELAIELKAKQNLLEPGNHTIFSVFARYSPVQLVLTNAQTIKFYQILLLSILGGCFLLFTRLRRKEYSGFFVAEMAFITALIPMFAFTSQNAFLFTTPSIIVLLYNARQLSGWEKGFLTIALILIGGNIRDLVGAQTYEVLNNLSVYTFGTIMLLILLFCLRNKHLKLRTS